MQTLGTPQFPCQASVTFNREWDSHILSHVNLVLQDGIMISPSSSDNEDDDPSSNSMPKRSKSVAVRPPPRQSSVGVNSELPGSASKNSTLERGLISCPLSQTHLQAECDGQNFQLMIYMVSMSATAMAKATITVMLGASPPPLMVTVAVLPTVTASPMATVVQTLNRHSHPKQETGLKGSQSSKASGGAPQTRQ